MSNQPTEYIESLKSKYAEFSEILNKISYDYRHQLWHQLTLKVSELVEKPNFQLELIHFYSHFLSFAETKLNQLAFVKIAVVISKQYAVEDAIQFMQKIQAKVSSQKDNIVGKEAFVLASSELALLQLKANHLEECKKLIEESKKQLDTVTGGDAAVHASFYLVSAEYQKVKGTAGEFYKNGLLYLAYANLDTLPAQFKSHLAFDLSLAALVGESIYNFGELLSQDILKSLEGGDKAWLVKLLGAFNTGNIQLYRTLSQQHVDQISVLPVLVNSQQILREKIAILGLMELVFGLPSDKRNIPFSTIAAATELQVQEVELLVMKALSLKLVKGTIDQVDQTVNITWVQPRVLGMEQIGKMKERLGGWNEVVRSTLLFLENETPELFS